MLIAFQQRVAAIDYPAALRDDVALLLDSLRTGSGRPSHHVAIEETDPGQYRLSLDAKILAEGLTRDQALGLLLDASVRALITDVDDAVVLHAAAVSWHDRSLLIPGQSGAGKTSLAAWFVEQGFEYLTDEVAVVTENGQTLPLSRPMVVKAGSRQQIEAFQWFKGRPVLEIGSQLAVSLKRKAAGKKREAETALIIFPNYTEGGELELTPLTAAQAARKLMECNVNVRNLPDGGLSAVAALASKAPALELRYGAYDQIEGSLDVLARWGLSGECRPEQLRQLLFAIHTGSPSSPPPIAAAKPSPPQSEIPGPTVRNPPKKFTVGMATYDDYDGVYFSLQALRMYHREAMDDLEFIVIDNHPDGACATALKKLERVIPNYRYVPQFERSSTAIRDVLFAEASGEFVLCMDCHVFLAQGALKRLRDYCESHPSSSDLLQGPLLFDDLVQAAPRMKPVWLKGMFGTFETRPTAPDPDGEPFEIEIQGLGLFACRRAAWPGFNPAFYGWGGEEGYIHEKFRQRGAKTLCLPFLQWVHRFQRPMGFPYPVDWAHRVRNYLIGFTELGMETKPVEDYYTELLGAEFAKPVFRDAWREISQAKQMPLEALPRADRR